MSVHGGRRDKAAQDAFVVELGYALCSALFAAAVVFGAVAGSALLFTLPERVAGALMLSGKVFAALLFVGRVISVMVRFGPSAQPSQPGRTNPDS
ncbi:DUF6332 family protein [Streptomyces sp. NPDC048002]|uniref:DUF6332 family protein n=1 Tax=Streptomyces sp. NPDC048002 TaxID=3154344 RepID=UPI003408B0F2